MADVRDYPWLVVTFVLVLTQILLTQVLPSQESAPLEYAAIGMFAIWIPLEFLPFWHLQRYGKVAKGDSYMETTRVVDRGVFSVVRHPQFVAWLFFSSGWMLVTQHWVGTLVGTLALVAEVLNIRGADRVCVRDFGADYADYQRRVPMMNVAAGLWRRIGATS